MSGGSSFVLAARCPSIAIRHHGARLRKLLMALGVSVLLVGCAARGTSGGGQHNIVTSADLARAGNVSLYDALVQVRPAFLRSRGVQNAATPPQPIRVYVGRLEMEGLEHLREIMARNVKEVRFLEPSQANARFGGNNNGGALVITMN